MYDTTITKLDSSNDQILTTEMENNTNGAVEGILTNPDRGDMRLSENERAEICLVPMDTGNAMEGPNRQEAGHSPSLRQGVHWVIRIDKELD